MIIEGCGNPIIGEMLQSLFARINFLRARSMSREGRGKNSSVEMWRIYAAIESHNVRAARAAAIQHVKSACAAAQEVFAEDSERGNPRGGGRLRKKEVAGSVMR